MYGSGEPSEYKMKRDERVFAGSRGLAVMNNPRQIRKVPGNACEKLVIAEEVFNTAQAFLLRVAIRHGRHEPHERGLAPAVRGVHRKSLFTAAAGGLPRKGQDSAERPAKRRDEAIASPCAGRQRPEVHILCSVHGFVPSVSF